MNFERELEDALQISRLAGEMALRHLALPPSAEEKPDRSPVTEADRECEQLISFLLERTYPEDGILGEEGAFKPSKSGRRWIIDPIDGTRDFVRRNPFWATQVALEVQDEIVLGVVHLPLLEEVLYATAGAGCYWNHSRVTASEIADLSKAVLLISGFQSSWDVWPVEAIRSLTQRCWTVRAYGACYDIVMIARGKADVWLSGNGMPWDYAPARIIAQEAGACFLTQDGNGRIDAGHCAICAPRLGEALAGIIGFPA